MLLNKKLIVFTLVTYLVSWACWLPIINALPADVFKSSANVLLLFLLGAYAPSLVGITLTYFYERGQGLKALFKRAFSVRVGAAPFLAAIVTGPILYTVATIFYVAFGGDVGAVNYGLLPWIPVVFVVPVVFGPLAEEFGWRGFALPQLDHKNKVVAASLIVGLIWALWHAPLFWAATGTAISGFPVAASSIALFFGMVIGASFLHTWLFNRANGSVFIAIMLHLSMNACGTITNMLFPEMSLEQKFDLYEYFVLAIWLLVVAVGLLKLKSRNNVLKSAAI
ncbi:CPBP family intramembrane metalloprotease [Cellvibrio zantedeschiae]|uniref:CPBP family intramembrane metalloprotease n=1 Tax=Cellvibrio zantedeschiae TaxID=1237077 RepID=A0ABQ3BEQ3_9GAMM|nr:type II CAAX endopeptidase family protein [Cellvibrio zantedeschiae]GGY86980.1 CPBP family intramembrane metalloprotease [Cellvibrio zantedeschiae]